MNRRLQGKGEILIWEARTGKSVQTLSGHTGLVYGLAFSPDGRFLASAGDHDLLSRKPGEVKIWDVAERKERATLRSDFGNSFGMALTPDRKTLVVGLDQDDAKAGTTGFVISGRPARIASAAVISSPAIKLLRVGTIAAWLRP